MKRHILWTAALVLAGFGLAQAQGTQTGTISGTVHSADGLAFPGVTVTVKSPALQGTRTTTTTQNGAYIFKALPPGAYSVTFEVSGMKPAEKKATLELGRALTVDQTLVVSGVSEELTVTESLPSIIETTSGGANFKGAEIDSLATGRTIAAIAELAPGLTDNSPNAGQVTIGGSFSYDNVFLVDGVDVNDNLYGSPNDLFIEEAVEEQQVLTSGISAEYGRFGGGIINTVTKRGGNEFSGAFRVNFTNSAWTDETPYEKDKGIETPSKTNRTYEATLGGPILKDKLWFFVAGRTVGLTTSRTYPDLGTPLTTKNDNQRAIVKLTGTIARNHTFTGNFTSNSSEQTQPSFSTTVSSGLRSIDPRTMYTRTLPNTLFGLNYNGVLTPNLFAEVNISQKKFQFKDAGGTNKDLIEGSPFLTVGVTVPGAGHYNAPYFDATDPEDRDNRQIAANLSYFLTTSSLGTHDIKFGYENFQTTRTGGNSQSPTNYVFYADYLTAGGKPVLANDRYIPVWVPETSNRILYVANRGAVLDITTHSFFVNDKWQATSKLSANIGARFEIVKSEATGNIVAVDTTAFAPRLGVSYDLKGDGKIRLDATYSRYAHKYNDTQIGSSSDVGNPSYVYQLYVGPAGQGMNFAPAYDPANYVNIAGGIPTANVFTADGLHSPRTDEWTLGAGFALPKNGALKVIYSNRQTKDFIETIIDTTTGSTVAEIEGVEVGPFDNVRYENSNLPTRKYQAVTLNGNIRPATRWNLNANYTYQIKNEGDFEGEARNQPGTSTFWGNYPGLYVQSRNYPMGRLAGFQRHKARAWTSYDFGLGKAGTLTPSLLYRYDSALPYSHTATSVPFTTIQKAAIAGQGYASPPANQTIFFGERGENDFEDTHFFDFALNYAVPVYKKLRPWVKFECRNIFNNDKLVTWNTTVTRDTKGPVDQYGLPTQYIKGSNYGKRTGAANYPIGRTIQFAIGFRF